MGHLALVSHSRHKDENHYCIWNAFYQAFSAAENACAGQSQEGGYGSCLAVQLRWLSDDCRTLNHDAVMSSLAGHEEFYDGCMVEAFPANADSSLGWQWPGAYPYSSMDKSLFSFTGCLKTMYIGTCQQNALDFFACH